MTSIWSQRDDYAENHCWQYDIRLRNRNEDLVRAALTETKVKHLTTADFEFRPIEVKTDEWSKAIEFIHKHEWLGTLDKWPTHYFGAYYDDILAGVIIFSVPNSKNHMDTERLISRGACISWSPPNLASTFLMWCIKHMVATTPYRSFSAYSDPDARELGTIYQACNFYYLGAGAGATHKYANPYKRGQWVTDRYFRLWRTYRRYAGELGIDWKDEWHHGHGMYWDKVPDDIEKRLRDRSLEVIHSTTRIRLVKKHKYVFVLGADKRETRRLRSEFEASNEILPYPKDRGATCDAQPND